MRWETKPSPLVAQRIAGLARAGLAARPDHFPLWITLGEALEGSDDLEGAIAHWQAAAAKFPDRIEPRLALAGALHCKADFAASYGVLETVGDSPKAFKLALRLLMRLRRWEEAAQAADRLAQVEPTASILLEYRALKASGDPARMLAACDAVLGASPGDSRAVFQKALALARLGRDDEAAALMAVRQFVRSVPLTVGAGDQAAFRQALRREIEANPGLMDERPGHATQQGQNSRIVDPTPDGPGAALIAAVRSAVADYSAAVAREGPADHPFVRSVPEHARLHGWAVILGEAGYQATHIHPGGWMTCVYYVAVPAAPPPAGVLRIGGLEPRDGVTPPWPVLDVAPVPGQLVMMPSYLPHLTVPTGCDEIRISVAFDIIAA